MDELLGEDRAPRAFRAKFPEEVLQESLAGQLWFGKRTYILISLKKNTILPFTNQMPLNLICRR